uniref:Uncharacterized protein n=1 Tax=Anopheles atroparvus TaxID=41427 RepID=A0AAG5DW53_ANOAO
MANDFQVAKLLSHNLHLNFLSSFDRETPSRICGLVSCCCSLDCSWKMPSISTISISKLFCPMCSSASCRSPMLSSTISYPSCWVNVPLSPLVGLMDSPTLMYSVI